MFHCRFGVSVFHFRAKLFVIFAGLFTLRAYIYATSQIKKMECVLTDPLGLLTTSAQSTDMQIWVNRSATVHIRARGVFHFGISKRSFQGQGCLSFWYLDCSFQGHGCHFSILTVHFRATAVCHFDISAVHFRAKAVSHFSILTAHFKARGVCHFWTQLFISGPWLFVILGSELFMSGPQLFVILGSQLFISGPRQT